ncbi:MAG: hypothetical protein ACRBBR_15055 [Cellvibrionaceae bacterium]
MKKSYIFIVIALMIIGLVYAAFYNDEAWHPKEGRLTSSIDYLEDADVMKMIEKQLGDVDYAAIVYATEARTTPNSWFHRVIVGNPYDSTYYEIKADVEHTVLGPEYSSINYTSAGRADSRPEKPEAAYAMLVLLCGDSSDHLYAPETAYEFPASKEMIEYFKQREKLPALKQDSSVCP